MKSSATAAVASAYGIAQVSNVLRANAIASFVSSLTGSYRSQGLTCTIAIGAKRPAFWNARHPLFVRAQFAKGRLLCRRLNRGARGNPINCPRNGVSLEHCLQRPARSADGGP